MNSPPKQKSISNHNFAQDLKQLKSSILSHLCSNSPSQNSSNEKYVNAAITKLLKPNSQKPEATFEEMDKEEYKEEFVKKAVAIAETLKSKGNAKKKSVKERDRVKRERKHMSPDLNHFPIENMKYGQLPNITKGNSASIEHFVNKDLRSPKFMKTPQKIKHGLNMSSRDKKNRYGRLRRIQNLSMDAGEIQNHKNLQIGSLDTKLPFLSGQGSLKTPKGTMYDRLLKSGNNIKKTKPKRNPLSTSSSVDPGLSFGRSDINVSTMKNYVAKKMNEQVKLLNKLDKKRLKEKKEVNKQNADEILAQQLSNRHQRALSDRTKMAEEKFALESNIAHLTKMEQRYKNIFNKIENKHSAIQSLYNSLGRGKNNLANSERDKDKMIEEFTDKQIQQYQVKALKEEEELRGRKNKMLKEMMRMNQSEIKRKIGHKIGDDEDRSTKLSFMMMLARGDIPE
ncbi:unnamed protein product [Moneuplotes crassus]|uniref:Uncharacterized protein n=1 Tax=Euplotes crassus TaxID=5936 RepID=A0AAD1U1G1_EUPCR|nr:unnamed protein product [Moneuplotes crassus]